VAGAPVGLLAAAAFCSAAALRVCDSLLPRFGAEFGRSPGETGGLIVAFAVAYGGMQLLIGPLADRFGKHRLVALALVGCGAFSALAAASATYEILWWVRIAWGMAAAGVIPLSMAWIGDSVAYEQRQATLARLLLGTLSGMVAGQLLGGLFATAEAGWRGAFLTLSAGYWLIGAMLLVRNARTHEAHAAQASPLGHGVPAVLRSKWARWVLVTVFVEGMFLIAPVTYLPTYLHQSEGISIGVASVIAATNALGGFVYAMTARRIVGAIGEARMPNAGGWVIAFALCGLWLLPHPVAAAAFSLLLGFGTYLLHGTLQTHATQMAPAARGTAVSLFASALFTGQAVGVAAFGPVVDAGAYGWLLLLPAAVLLATGAGYVALSRQARAAA
jgi:YNFM family putative membrane transporter